MPTTRTEDAIAALVAAMQDVANANPAIPAPTRNAALVEMLDSIGEAEAGRRLNVVDGSGEVVDVMLGAPRPYEIAQVVTVEWLVKAGAAADRDAMFDAGLVAIGDAVDALTAAIGAGAVTAVDHAEIEGGVDRTNLAIEGVPQLKGGIVEVRLEFRSERPF